MRRQLLSALRVTVVLTVLLGLVYPAVMTGIAQLAFASRANGSLAKDAKGQVVGSHLIGQTFADKDGNPLAQYFQPRPSATVDANSKPLPYNSANSAASNLGPSNPDLLKAVADRVASYRQFNQLTAGTPVPVDAVTSSGSGLDPDISVANARDQVARVAAARHVPTGSVEALVSGHINPRAWGVLGEDTVNVLDLNLALDRSLPVTP
jgi:K+-transporting ATPase ATPase C chain